MSITSGARGPGSPTFRSSLAALPFTLVMRALNGGSFAFGGDMTGRVIAAGLFGSALAYLAGLIVETIVRFLVRLALKTRPPGA